MNTTPEPQHIIPARYRHMENLHIIFWLLKDVAWCLEWKPLAVVMIVPTLIISIIIAYRTRAIKSELAHNLAITFWITANATWMITEFVGFDEVQLSGPFLGKHIALVPFVIGILLLADYYLFQKRKQEAGEVVTL